MGGSNSHSTITGGKPAGYPSLFQGAIYTILE
jgi:hypothetical protein